MLFNIQPPGQVSNNPTSGFPNKFELEAPSSEEAEKGSKILQLLEFS